MHFVCENQIPQYEDDKVPYHLKRYVLPSSLCVYKLFEEGEILTQYINGPDYTIWLHYFLTSAPVQLHPSTEHNILMLQYMRKGTVSANLHGLGELTLHAGKYHLFYIPGGMLHTVALPAGCCCCFHVDLHPDYFVSIAREYPVFEPLLSSEEQGLTEGKQHFASPITPAVDAIIDSIIHCQMSEAERTLFFDARVRDLLRLYVEDQAARQEVKDTPLPKSALIRTIDEYIGEHLDDDLSVHSLSVRFSISKAWLQRLFQRYYNQAVHERINDKRMEKAKLLLITTTIRVGKIAADVSPLTFASFCTAFKSYYSKSPAEYRREYTQNQNPD